VAIGLALIVKQEFALISQEGAAIGAAIITTVTATSVFFEVIGPILTRIALQKAQEVPETPKRANTREVKRQTRPAIHAGEGGKDR
jgi:hypothetical protein